MYRINKKEVYNAACLLAENIDFDARKDETLEEMACIFTTAREKQKALDSVEQIKHAPQRAWARIRCLILNPSLFIRDKYQLISTSMNEVESATNQIEKTWTLMRIYQSLFDLTQGSAEIDFFTKMVKTASKIGDEHEASRALGEIAGIFVEKGIKNDLNEFITLFIKIIETNIVNPAVKTGLYGVAGGICLSFSEKETALFWIRKAVIVSEMIPYFEDRVWSLCVLSEIMYQYGEKKAALKIFRQIKNMISKLENYITKGELYSKIGTSLAQIGEFDLSCEFFAAARLCVYQIENDYSSATLSLAIEERYINSGLHTYYNSEIQEKVSPQESYPVLSKEEYKYLPREMMIADKALKILDMGIKWQGAESDYEDFYNLIAQ